MTEYRNTEFLGSLAKARIVEVDTDFGVCTLQAPPMADVMACMAELQRDDDADGTVQINAMVHLLALSIGASDDEAWGALAATGGANGPLMLACLKLCGVDKLTEAEETEAQVEVDNTLPFVASQ